MKSSVANHLEDLGYHYRHGSYKEVCVRAGALLENQLCDIYKCAAPMMSQEVALAHVASLKDSGLGTKPERWSLGQLVRICQRSEVQVVLQEVYPHVIKRVGWDSLLWVAELRNKAAHGVEDTPSPHDALLAKSEAERFSWLFDDGIEPSVPFARAVVYPNFYDAVGAVVPLLSQALAAEPTIRIRVLGLTLSKAWHSVANQIMPTLRRRRNPPALLVDLAMLDPDWPEVRNLHPLWQAEARHAADYIPNAAPDFVRHAAPGLRMRLFKYRHTPTYHGLIVNSNIAIGSASTMKGGRATGAEARYFAVRREAGDLEQFLVEEMCDAWDEASGRDTAAVVDVSSPGTAPSEEP